MHKPPMVGTINGHAASTLYVGRRRGSFDGTTVDMVRAALRLGARPGDLIRADFAGNGCDARPYRLVSAPHDSRTGGYWADREER